MRITSRKRTITLALRDKQQHRNTCADRATTTHRVMTAVALLAASRTG